MVSKSINIHQDEFEIIDEAAKLDRRSVNSVIIKGALDYAKKIIQRDKKDKELLKIE